MSKETVMTVVGNVVKPPQRNRTANGSVTNFRIASTSRRYDKGLQGWVDHKTLFLDVECWGDLGGNVSSSISKGDPVMVRGTLTTHSWETENGRRSTPRIRAFAVGPNLARGSSVFRRTQAARTAAPVELAVGGSLGPDAAAAGDGEFSAPPDGALTREDYETDHETLHDMDPEDLSREAATL